jgi:hypothetical protein
MPGMPMHSSIGESKTYHSIPIETLSLCLCIISAKNIDTDDHGMILLKMNDRIDMQRKLNEALSEYTLNTLTTLSSPVKFLSLRQVWENISRLRLNGRYSIYKELFEQVHTSVLTDPLQVVNQEEAISTLLETMLFVEHKNMRLVDTLFDKMKDQGINTNKWAFRIFDALMTLGSDSVATTILLKMHDNIKEKVGQVYSGARSSVMNLSATSKEKIFALLRNKEEYEYTDLALALNCFGRGASTPHYRLFCVIEQSVQRNIEGLRAVDLLDLYCGYAKLGRKHPDLIAAIDKKMDKFVDNLEFIRLTRLIWCAARLNHKPVYFHRILTLLLSSLRKTTSQKNLQGTQLLWSLAVLEELTLEVNASRFFHIHLQLISNCRGFWY